LQQEFSHSSYQDSLLTIRIQLVLPIQRTIAILQRLKEWQLEWQRLNVKLKILILTEVIYPQSTTRTDKSTIWHWFSGDRRGLSLQERRERAKLKLSKLIADDDRLLMLEEVGERHVRAWRDALVQESPNPVLEEHLAQPVLIEIFPEGRDRPLASVVTELKKRLASVDLS
jgi:hypothetical protein